MEKKYLLLILFLLLLIPNVKADLLNISEPLTIYEDNDWASVPNPYVYSSDAIFDSSVNRWFIGSLHTNEYDIAVFDSNMTTNILGWKVYPSPTKSMSGAKLLDYNTTHLVLYTFQQAQTNKMTLNKTYISKEDLSFEDDTSTGYYNTLMSSSAIANKNIGVAEDGTILTVNQTSGNYPQLQIIEPDSSTIFNISNCPMCYLKNITDLNLVKVNDEYWVIARAYTYSSLNWSVCSKIYIERFQKHEPYDHYDTVSGTSYEQLSTGCVLDPLASFPATMGQNKFAGSLAVKRIGDYIYFATREAEPPTENNNTIYFRVLSINDFLATGQPAIAEERHNLEDYDDGLNNSMIAIGLGIGYNSIKQNWVLSYNKFKNIDGTLSSGATRYHQYAFKSYESCICNAWQNTSSCGIEIPSNQKQIRTCLPENCDDTIQWIPCTETPTEIIYKNNTLSSVCYSDKVDPSKVSKISCSASVELPEDCAIAEDYAILYPFIEHHLYSKCNLGASVFEKICNPIEQDCSYQIPTCGNFLIDANVTFNKTYGSYLASQTATAYFEMAQIGNCQGEALGWQKCGWKTARLSGVLLITCKQPCGDRKVCYTIGNNVYSIDELTDCKLNSTQIDSEHLCTLGCTEDTGICVGQEVTTTISISDSCLESEDFIYCSIESFDVLFQPETLLMISVMVIAISMVATQYFAKDWRISTVSGMLVATMFWKLTWLDSIYFILWVLTIGIVWANSLSKAVKGD